MKIYYGPKKLLAYADEPQALSWIHLTFYHQKAAIPDFVVPVHLRINKPIISEVELTFHGGSITAERLKYHALLDELKHIIANPSFEMIDKIMEHRPDFYLVLLQKDFKWVRGLGYDEMKEILNKIYGYDAIDQGGYITVFNPKEQVEILPENMSVMTKYLGATSGGFHIASMATTQAARIALLKQIFREPQDFLTDPDNLVVVLEQGEWVPQQFQTNTGDYGIKPLKVSKCVTTKYGNDVPFYVRENVRLPMGGFSTSSAMRWAMKHGRTPKDAIQVLEITAMPRVRGNSHVFEDLKSIVKQADGMHRDVIENRLFTTAWAEQHLKELPDLFDDGGAASGITDRFKDVFAKKEAYQILDSDDFMSGSTWTAGGCGLAARTLQLLWGGGELHVLAEETQPGKQEGNIYHHVVLKYGSFYYDADGPHTEEWLLQDYPVQENISKPGKPAQMKLIPITPDQIPDYQKYCPSFGNQEQVTALTEFLRKENLTHDSGAIHRHAALTEIINGFPSRTVGQEKALLANMSDTQRAAYLHALRFFIIAQAHKGGVREEPAYFRKLADDVIDACRMNSDEKSCGHLLRQLIAAERFESGAGQRDDGFIRLFRSKVPQ